MSIGNHTIGKMFMQLRASVSGGLSALYTNQKHYEMPTERPFNQNGVTAEDLPRAPVNPWRKRPIKMQYSRSDFEMFRLPSEKAFLLGGMDYKDLFGKRQGMNHAPHIRSQMDLDTNIVLAACGLCFLLMVWEPARTHKFVTLRENMRNSDMGKFEAADFK